jgi:O-antigen/teichoic acid export membrane protein
MSSGVSINRNKIITSIATLFSGSFVAQGMTAVTLLLTARQLQVDNYGQYAACITLTSMLAIVFSLGLDIWLLREGGKAPQRIGEIAGSVLGIKGLLGIAWVLILFMAAPLFNQQSFPTALLRWSVILLWSDTLFATCLTAFKSSMHNRTPSILEAGADTLWFACTLVLMGYGALHPEAYMKIRVLVSLMALTLSILILVRRFQLNFVPAIAREALSQFFHFALSDFLGMVTMRVDVVIISVTLGTTATGLYSPAVGLVNMAFLAPMAIYWVMLPVLSNLYKNHVDQAWITAKRTVWLSLAVGLGLTLLYFFGAPFLPVILGPSYEGSVAVLRILSWILLFKCGSFAMATILVARNLQARRTLIQVVAASMNIILNLLIVYKYGINGVAVVYVLTEIVLFSGYSGSVWRSK